MFYLQDEGDDSSDEEEVDEEEVDDEEDVDDEEEYFDPVDEGKCPTLTLTP